MTDQAERVAEEVLAGLQTEALPVWVDSIEFMDEPDPDIEWVIPGLIERQSRTIIAGVEEGGKSLLTLTMAAQASVGYSVLERFQPERPLRVTYFDLEMGRRQTRRRLRMINESLRIVGKPLTPGSLGLVQKPDGYDLGERAERKDLYRRINEIRPDVIFFDPLYKLMTAEGYEREVKPFLQFLDKLRLDFDVAIVLVHHLRKRSGGESERGKDTSDIYGSSLLLRWPETIIALNQDLMRVDKDRDYVFGSNRAFPVMRGEVGAGRWLIALGNPTIAIDHRVLEYLQDAEEASGAGLSRELGVRKGDIYQSLRRLEAEGRVEPEGEGARKKWRIVEIAEGLSS